MSGMDVLRERIARALYDEHVRRYGLALKPWQDVSEGYLADADAVIAALELEEGLVSFDGERQRCWTTPWERIEGSR